MWTSSCFHKVTSLHSLFFLNDFSTCNNYKWKNLFSEMKGDVGMSHHEKEENKKMPIPRQEIIDNPIPTSLFMYYAAVLLCVGTGGAILGQIGTLVNVNDNFIGNKDVGMGLSMISCLGIGIFLFSSFS